MDEEIHRVDHLLSFLQVENIEWLNLTASASRSNKKNFISVPFIKKYNFIIKIQIVILPCSTPILINATSLGDDKIGPTNIVHAVISVLSTFAVEHQKQEKVAVVCGRQMELEVVGGRSVFNQGHLICRQCDHPISNN